MEKQKKTRKVRVKAETKSPDLTEYRFSLDVYIFEEGDNLIAYCPSLDISTSGKDFNDAVANFYECLQLHVESCVEHGTLIQDLLEHGWKMRKTAVSPPSFTSLLKKDEDLRNLLGGKKAYERIVVPAKVSLAV